MTTTRRSGKGASRGGRLVGLGGVLGGLGGVLTFSPAVGAAILGCGVALVSLIVLTALYGRETCSTRAFRLLRLVTAKPEPVAPTNTKATPEIPHDVKVS